VRQELELRLGRTPLRIQLELQVGGHLDPLYLGVSENACSQIVTQQRAWCGVWVGRCGSEGCQCNDLLFLLHTVYLDAPAWIPSFTIRSMSDLALLSKLAKFLFAWILMALQVDLTAIKVACYLSKLLSNLPPGLLDERMHHGCFMAA
jgi:hypothetical protein